MAIKNAYRCNICNLSLIQRSYTDVPADNSPVVAVAGVITRPPVSPHVPHKGLCPGRTAPTPLSDR